MTRSMLGNSHWQYLISTVKCPERSSAGTIEWMGSYIALVIVPCPHSVTAPTSWNGSITHNNTEISTRKYTHSCCVYPIGNTNVATVKAAQSHYTLLTASVFVIFKYFYPRLENWMLLAVWRVFVLLFLCHVLAVMSWAPRGQQMYHISWAGLHHRPVPGYLYRISELLLA